MLTIELDVAIPLRDGSALRANIYRPSTPGSYPVVMTVGPYGKDTHFSDFNPVAYSEIEEHGAYLNWETPNPEWWVPLGYVLIRVDQRGAGRSPGRLDLFSPQQSEDFYDAIEWAGVQPWSTGKVGLLGVSYYATSQWQVAALQPPHLAAMIPWEGAADLYRESARHGGILSNAFVDAWWPRQVVRAQHGVQTDLTEAELVRNRVNLPADLKRHFLDDAYYRARSPEVNRITVPLLSVGNWGGLGLHLRGNVEGYLGAASQHKWLQVHTGSHLGPFYSHEGRARQERFFARWLKGQANGAEADPPIRLAIRTADGFSWRHEHEWPLARTEWTRLYLDAAGRGLGDRVPQAMTCVDYAAPSGGATFTTEAFPKDTEVTGPLALRLWVSSSTSEMDLFVTIRNLDPAGRDVTVTGANNPAAPVTKGWLRVSQRKLDAGRSTAYRPYHAHHETQKLTPQAVVPVDVEIWPTSMVWEAGHRLALDIEAHDGVGSAPFLHTDPDDRNPTSLAGTNTIHTGGDRASFLLLPVIPIA